MAAFVYNALWRGTDKVRAALTMCVWRSSIITG